MFCILNNLYMIVDKDDVTKNSIHKIIIHKLCIIIF